MPGVVRAPRSTRLFTASRILASLVEPPGGDGRPTRAQPATPGVEETIRHCPDPGPPRRGAKRLGAECAGRLAPAAERPHATEPRMSLGDDEPVAERVVQGVRRRRTARRGAYPVAHDACRDDDDPETDRSSPARTSRRPPRRRTATRRGRRRARTHSEARASLHRTPDRSRTAPSRVGAAGGRTPYACLDGRDGGRSRRLRTRSSPGGVEDLRACRPDPGRRCSVHQRLEEPRLDRRVVVEQEHGVRTVRERGADADVDPAREAPVLREPDETRLRELPLDRLRARRPSRRCPPRRRTAARTSPHEATEGTRACRLARSTRERRRQPQRSRELAEVVPGRT